MWKGPECQGAARDGDVLPLPAGQCPHRPRPVPLPLGEVRSAGWAWQQGSAQSPGDETSPQAGWEVKSVD